jgi:hypothetical protein
MTSGRIGVIADVYLHHMPDTDVQRVEVFPGCHPPRRNSRVTGYRYTREVVDVVAAHGGNIQVLTDSTGYPCGHPRPCPAAPKASTPTPDAATS